MNILSFSTVLGISFFLFLGAYKATLLQKCKDLHFSTAIEHYLNPKFKLSTPIYNQFKWESYSCRPNINLIMNLRTNIDYEKSNR